MSTYDEIEKAIGAHGRWKQKLRQAIDTGESESIPVRVKMDYNCSFGKWLYHKVDSSVKTSLYYSKAIDLHAEFHKEAGYILELALDGKKEEAYSRIKLGSNFSRISSRLTSTLNTWKASL
jgi:hypothetical protein